jgi:hypothetical protein
MTRYVEMCIPDDRGLGCSVIVNAEVNDNNKTNESNNISLEI